MILQGDHGPGSGLEQEDAASTDLRERLSILNALNLPGAEDALYESLTPVNTFRVVLSAYSTPAWNFCRTGAICGLEPTLRFYRRHRAVAVGSCRRTVAYRSRVDERKTLARTGTNSFL